MFTFDGQYLVASILYSLCRRLNFASTYSKSIVDSYFRQQLDELLIISNEQQISIFEPSKKEHKPIEKQFDDPDNNNNIDNITQFQLGP